MTKKLSIILFGIIASLIFFYIYLNGKFVPVVAAGQIKISSELELRAVGIKTLFITVFDASPDNPAPFMPLAAYRDKINEHPKGVFYDFKLTESNLQFMNPNHKLPAKIKLKARLDQDGRGGRDQPGDLTGSLDSIALGQKDILIEIDHLVR